MALNIITQAVLQNRKPANDRQKSRKLSATGHTGRDRAAYIPAFLQIRPGKADYCDLFSSPSPVWVEGESRYF